MFAKEYRKFVSNQLPAHGLECVGRARVGCHDRRIWDVMDSSGGM